MPNIESIAGPTLIGMYLINQISATFIMFLGYLVGTVSFAYGTYPIVCFSSSNSHNSLFGIMSAQTVYYFRAYPGDHKCLKALVSLFPLSHLWLINVHHRLHCFREFYTTILSVYEYKCQVVKASWIVYMWFALCKQGTLTSFEGRCLVMDQHSPAHHGQHNASDFLMMLTLYF